MWASCILFSDGMKVEDYEQFLKNIKITPKTNDVKIKKGRKKQNKNFKFKFVNVYEMNFVLDKHCFRSNRKKKFHFKSAP